MLVVMLVMTLGSCKKGNKIERHTVVEEPEIVDSSVIVGLDKVEGNHISVTIQNTGESRTYSYDKAQTEGHVKGSLIKGDKLSIYPDSKSKEIRSLVNLSELETQWFFDMNQHRGMKIGSEGAISSINMEDVSFRNWFIRNGQLIIHYVDMQQRADSVQQYWVDHSEIIYLSKDKLDMRFRGKILQCQHQTKVIKFKF
jgi:hypothetical protein